MIRTMAITCLPSIQPPAVTPSGPSADRGARGLDSRFSVGFCPRRLDHFLPFPDFGLDVGAEFLRGGSDDLEAQALEPLDDLGQLQDLHDLGIEPRDDRPRRT